MTTPRWESMFALAVMTLLAAAAVVLSIHSAPPVAEQQLQIGAGATIGAGSFVMDLTQTRTSAGATPGAPAQQQVSQLHFVYQAPDSLDETVSQGAQTAERIIVGDVAYVRSGKGPWKGGVDPTLGPSAVSDLVLLPGTVTTKASPVTRHGQTSSAFYVFGLADTQLAELFGPQAPAQLTGHAFTARIDKEYMTGQNFTVSTASLSEVVAIRYSEIGTAPPVRLPVTASAHGAG